MRALHAGLLIALLVCGTALPATHTVGSLGQTRSDDAGISIDRVGTWYSSANATNFQRAADVREGIQSGNFSHPRSLADEGTLVIALEIQNFGTLLANTVGANTTERFRTVFGQHGEFAVEQLYPPSSRPPIRVHVLDGPGVRVFADRANGTYYVVLDFRTVRSTYRDGEAVELDSAYYDEPYDVQVSLDESLTATSEPTRGGAMIGARDATVDTASDGQPHVRVGETLTVSGTTTAGTGQNLTVILRGADDPTTETNESVVRRKTATIGPQTDHHHYESRIETEFTALPRLTNATNLTVSVRIDGEVLDTVPVSISILPPNVSVENATVWRTTESKTFETVDEIESSRSSGSLSQAENLSGGGTMVIRFQMPGFDRLLARTNGTNTTARFQQAIRRFGDLSFAQTNPPAQIAPVVFTLLDDRGVRFLGDTANDTYYIVVDLQRVGTVYESSDATSIAPRARFELSLSFDGSVTASGNQTVVETFVPSHRISINQSEGLTVEPGENLTINGTANLGPFEPIQVVLRGRDDPATVVNESVRRTKTVYLGQPIAVTNGTWSYTAVFERTASLRSVQNLTVRAREVDGSVTSERVPVEVVTATPTATETATATATPTTSARTSTAPPTDESNEAATTTPTTTASESVSASETVSVTPSERSTVTESAPPQSSDSSPSTTGSVPGFGFFTVMCSIVTLLGVGQIVGAWRNE